MAQKIKGQTNAVGLTGWIFTDHGQTYYGFDDKDGVVSQTEVVVEDKYGVTLIEKNSRMYVAAVELEFMIKALQKAQKKIKQLQEKK